MTSLAGMFPVWFMDLPTLNPEISISHVRRFVLHNVAIQFSLSGVGTNFWENSV